MEVTRTVQLGRLEVWACGWSPKDRFTPIFLPLQEVGRRMGLDTHKLASLWKDQAVIEINVAVLHSFQVRRAFGESQDFLVRRSYGPATHVTLDFPLIALSSCVTQGLNTQFVPGTVLGAGALCLLFTAPPLESRRESGIW